MIELKELLNIPEGYYIKVDRVRRGGISKELIMQDVTVKEVRKNWFDRTIGRETIFLNTDGTLRHRIITIEDLQRILDNRQSTLIAGVRPGRHP